MLFVSFTTLDLSQIEKVMKFKEVQSVEDLKSAGSIDELIDAIQREIHPLKVDAKSYEELLKVINTLKEKWLPLSEGPFISKQAEYTYYLTKLEGKQRNKALGIVDEYYENPEAAKKWRKKIENYVHPDKGGDRQAFDTLRKLYNVMVDVEEE
jgi:hypothetical protein